MGAIPVAMPQLGMTMEEGTVVEWPVAPGARVEKGQTVLVIETEKAESEVEATASGFFRHVYVAPGETVACGTLLGALTETADEPFDPDAFAAAYAPPAPKPKAARPPAAAPGRARVAGETEPPAPGGRRPVAPAARAAARKLGIDVDAVPGTGPGGRVTKQDVEAYAVARERLTRVEEGVALEVLREGEGDPVVFLPGFGTDVSSFALQIRALAEGFTCTGVNPRGVGLSDAPDTERYDVARAAEDVAALLEVPAHVVGASLGAAAALELALAHRDRVRSLTLVTPFVETTPRLRAVAQAWCRIAEEASPETLAHALAPWLFGEALLGDAAARERTLRGMAPMLRRIPAATLRRAAAGMAAWSGTRADSLSGLKTPTLVLVAGADLLTPDGEAIAAAIPSAKCVVVPGAGHALAVEGAEAVSEALRGHLESA
jgi:pimeloyl-ACP methyl ester carboxylesterase